jgi:hypothetical protein
MRPLAAVALAAMLLLSGCATQAFTETSEPAPSNATTPATTAPAATTDDETTTTADATATATEADSSWDDDEVPDGEDRSVNDTATFRNLTALVDVNATRPTTKTIGVPTRDPSPPTLLTLLGLDEVEDTMLGETFGYVTGEDRIYVAFNGAPDRAAERLVVHEQFHTIQFQQGWIADLDRDTADGRLANQGVIEGTAVWVTGEYVERYEGPDAPSGYGRYLDSVEDGPDGNRLLNSPYLFGARWTEHHLDDPANVSWAYDNRPETTEQVMHNLTPAEEPPLPVDLDVQSEEYFDRDGDRMGELYAWATLRGELSANRSRTAAAGWGGDELRMVADTTGEVESLAWALRWDSERDADEFAAAAADWVNERDGNASFRFVRANDTVTLLLAGDEAFVDDADVSLDGTTVVVTRDAAASANESRLTTGQVTSQESSPTS